MLLDPTGHVYLSDFGLSKHAVSIDGETRSGHWVGTLDYVAPEQIRGERLDARADVYALGGVLYFALTGHAPFPREGDEAKLWAQLTEPPPRATDSVPGLAPEFDAVIARGLAKRPDDRYPSAGDLGRAALAAAGLEAPHLRERAVGVGAAAPEETPTESASARDAVLRSEALTEVERPPERPRRRRRAALATGLGALVAVGVGGVVLSATGGQGEGGSDPTATPQASATATATPAKPTVETVARVGRRPNSIALGRGTVFATNFYDRHVTMLDERTGKRRGKRPEVGVGARDSALGFGALWVAVSRGAAVAKLDPATGKQLARIATPHRPQALAIGRDAVWVGMSALDGSSKLTPGTPDSLARIDPKTNMVTRTYPMKAGVRSLVATRRGIWIVNRGYATVSRFDPAAGKLDKRVDLIASALGGATYAAGDVWVVLPDEDTVVRVDDKTGRKVSIGVGRHPTGIAARGKQIWVTSFIDHTLTRIDPKTNRTVGKPVQVPVNPYALAVTDDSVWLTAVGRGQIARVRLRGAG